MRCIFHRDVDRYLLTFFDIRTIIRFGWVNQYCRQLSSDQLDVVMKKLEPWNYYDRYYKVPFLWQLSKSVYFPVEPFMFAFHTDADKRKGYTLLIDKHKWTFKSSERQTCYFNTKPTFFYWCPWQSRRNTIYRWFEIFPNEMNSEVVDLVEGEIIESAKNEAEFRKLYGLVDEP